MTNNQPDAFIGQSWVRFPGEGGQYRKSRLFAEATPAPAEPPEEINSADDTEPVKVPKRAAAEGTAGQHEGPHR